MQYLIALLVFTISFFLLFTKRYNYNLFIIKLTSTTYFIYSNIDFKNINYKLQEIIGYN